MMRKITTDISLILIYLSSSCCCLVLGDNLLLMFVGWEGVGLCSYLLIGFWFRKYQLLKCSETRRSS
jgi:NADH:ubiquinone oxidoreductase subunit 5 (subunit L)/multisubunit Na+/H+ antiporter MnhA subunit